MGSIIVSSCLLTLAMLGVLVAISTAWDMNDRFEPKLNSTQKTSEPRFTRYENIFNDENNASLYFGNPFSKRKGDVKDEPNPTNETSGRALDLEALFGESSIPSESGEHKSQHQSPQSNPQPVFNPNLSQESYESQPVFSPNNPSYSYAGPENGKQAQFGGIGAALQNLAVFRPLKRKYGSAGYPQEQLTPGVDCLCVPFYMCKRGFLESSTAKNNMGNFNQHQHGQGQPSEEFIRQQFSAAQAEASSNFASAPLPSNLNSFSNQDSSPGSSLPQPSSSQPEGSYDMNLPLDERSIDPLSERNVNFPSNTTEYYSRETLGRMIGSAGSSCGVLRTCCRIAPEFPPQQLNPVKIGGHPSYSGHQGMESIPYPVQGYRPLNPNHRAPLQHHAGHQSNLPYLKPGLRKPAFALPGPGSLEILGASFMKPKQQYNQVIRPQFSLIHKPYQKPLTPHFGHRPQHVNRAINIPYPQNPSFATPFASSSLSVPTSHYQTSNHLQQPSPQYGQCGARSANSVQGRVQNLNYHESSAEFGEYPWMAALLKRIGPADSLYVCGAVLISPQWVLTAAHCIKENRAEDLKLRFGEWDVHRDDEYYPYVERFVTDIVIHPEFFQGNLINDIALIRFDSPVEFNSPHIASACLPEPYDNFVGHRCWVTGWGKNAFGQQGEYQSVLKEVDLPVVGQPECEQAMRSTRLGPYYQLHQGFMCAGGEGGKDACEGDGGSPLVCEVGGAWKVAGLVSWGIGCGQPGIPGVYANVAHYRQWIDSIVNRYARESSSNHISSILPGIIQERSNSLSSDAVSVREGRSSDGSNSTESPATITTTSS